VISGGCAAEKELSKENSDRSLLKTNPLHVVIHRDGQAQATLEAAALDHIPAVSSFHASAETVNTDPVANFGLVSSFRHSLFPFVPKLYRNIPVGYSLTVCDQKISKKYLPAFFLNLHNED
jgi:hypothetical protein